MRIVITGATGNVGTALVRRLTREGVHEIVGLARRVPARRPGVEWVSADLTDPAVVPSLVTTFGGADAVIHLAWGFQPSHDPAYLAELGVGGTRRVVEALTLSGVPHLLHMSSVGAYSSKTSDEPVEESYPTGGIARSPYSQHKVAAERLLDGFEQRHPEVTVTRMRPGIIGQGLAGSALLRYGVPAIVPARALGALPVLPLDGSLRIPMVHADDVAEAFVRAVERRRGGPFNLASGDPVTADDIADVLGARRLQVPRGLVRGAVSGAWHAHLLQLDPGWIDLAYQVPVLAVGRAARELEWGPAHSGLSALKETVTGMIHATAGETEILRPRTVLDGLRRAVRQGPVAHRHQP